MEPDEYEFMADKQERLVNYAYVWEAIFWGGLGVLLLLISS